MLGGHIKTIAALTHPAAAAAATTAAAAATTWAAAAAVPAMLIPTHQAAWSTHKASNPEMAKLLLIM
jgi:hypothetical protein